MKNWEGVYRFAPYPQEMSPLLASHLTPSVCEVDIRPSHPLPQGIFRKFAHNIFSFRSGNQRNSLTHYMENSCLKKFDEEVKNFYHMTQLYHSRISTPKNVPYHKKTCLSIFIAHSSWEMESDYISIN